MGSSFTLPDIIHSKHMYSEQPSEFPWFFAALAPSIYSPHKSLCAFLHKKLTLSPCFSTTTSGHVVPFLLSLTMLYSHEPYQFLEHSKGFLFLILGFLLMLFLPSEMFFPSLWLDQLPAPPQLSIQCLLPGEAFPGHSKLVPFC